MFLSLCSSVADKLSASNNMMEEKFDKIEKENEDLLSKNSDLTGEVVDLRERMRQIEQYSRRNNTEVSRVPLSRDLECGRPGERHRSSSSCPVLEGHTSRAPTFKRDWEPLAGEVLYDQLRRY